MRFKPLAKRRRCQLGAYNKNEERTESEELYTYLTYCMDWSQGLKAWMNEAWIMMITKKTADDIEGPG